MKSELGFQVTTFFTICNHFFSAVCLFVYTVVLWESSNGCIVYFMYVLKLNYICFHRMHEITSTAMEAMIPMAADRPTVALMATILGWENSSQRPHTGRQSEVFSTVVQEKLSWHWSVLQFSCWTSLAAGGGWMVVSSCPPLSAPVSTSIITVIVQ